MFFFVGYSSSVIDDFDDKVLVTFFINDNINTPICLAFGCIFCIINKVGENSTYSLNEISQPYANDTNREIDLLGQFTLFGESTSMFEVKYPAKDIIVRAKSA